MINSVTSYHPQASDGAIERVTPREYMYHRIRRLVGMTSYGPSALIAAVNFF
jgi:hypothetical protein